MRTSVYAKRKMLVYLAVFIALCIFSLVAGSFAPHDAELVNLLEAKKAPGGEYPMGTDWLGRCIFSRILCHLPAESADPDFGWRDLKKSPPSGGDFFTSSVQDRR